MALIGLCGGRMVRRPVVAGRKRTTSNSELTHWSSGIGYNLFPAMSDEIADRLRVRVARTGSVAVPLPAYQTSGAAGMDVCAALTERVELLPGQRRLVPTGLRLELPPGFEAQVRPRSGLALRHGLTVVNSPGTIDSDFRGEVGIVLINHGAEPVVLEPLMRIAQLVFARVEQALLIETDQLVESDRGAGGYGSTGVTGDAARRSAG